MKNKWATVNPDGNLSFSDNLPAPTSCEVCGGEIAGQCLCAINELRAKHGLEPVKPIRRRKEPSA